MTLKDEKSKIFNVVFVFFAVRMRSLYETRSILSSEAWAVARRFRDPR
jgi:hypothetical protein